MRLLCWCVLVAASCQALADYGDTVTCDDPAAVANLTEGDVLQYGQCLEYRQSESNRPVFCDVFYTKNVDKVFLPHGRAQNDLNVLLEWMGDINTATEFLTEPCRSVALRGLCYYYFPPCGNTTHFEAPSSICESSCRYATVEVCQQEWAQALLYFNSVRGNLDRLQIDILNCSQPNFLFNPSLPHCCSNAGVVDTVPTTIGTETMTKTSSSTEPQSSENNSNVAIIASSTIVAVVILVTIVLIVTVSVTLKRFRQSKKPQVVNNASIAAVEHKRYPDVIVHTDSSSCGLNVYAAANSNGRPTDFTQPSTSTTGGRMTRVASCYIRQMAEAKLLIPAEQIQLLDRVGQGEFGVVYRGHLVDWKGTKPTELVAVKTLKEVAYSSKDISDLVEESLKMKAFQHKNVLSLIGVCIDAGAAPYLVMPYMLNGSLLAYLRKKRPDLTIVEGAADELITEAKKKLLSMCLQIAKGMEYLAIKKFVHRDLAARNCMIDANFTIKVADFGLSEDVYCKDYFRQALKKNADEEGTVKLPIKWMALESLEDGIFTEKTDVWSFGITCWEVFSLGRSPYPGVDPFTLIKYLKEGKRLDKPANAACTGNVYDVILTCWIEEPVKRPSFADLVSTLTSKLEEVAQYLDFSALVKSEEVDHLQCDHTSDNET